MIGLLGGGASAFGLIRSRERGPGACARLRGVAAELLAQREGRGVLGVRAPNLDDVRKLLCLGVQRGLRMPCARCSCPQNPADSSVHFTAFHYKA